MLNRLLLNILLFFLKPLMRSSAADGSMVKLIVQTKLKLDDRTPRQIMFNQNYDKGANKPKRFRSIINFIMSMFMGFLFGSLILFFDSWIFGLCCTLFITQLFLFLSLFTDFNNLFFNTSDHNILSTKPLTAETIVWSKVIHIVIYIINLVLPFFIPIAIFMLRYGVFTILGSLILLIVTALLMLCCMVLMYYLIAKVVGIKRFRKSITFIQITLSVIFFLSIMMMSRIEDLQAVDIKSIHTMVTPGIYYLPTYWLASIMGWFVMDGEATPFLYSSIFPAITLVVFSLFVIILMRVGAKDIIKIMRSNDSLEEVDSNHKATTFKVKGKLGWWLPNNLQVAAYNFMYWYTSRNKAFKMAVLPSFFFTPIYILFMVTRNISDVGLKASLLSLGESKMFIFMLYLTVMFVTTFVSNFGISKQFKASWIFYTAPIENKGQFIMGALKYIYAKYILPMQAIIFIICMLVWGWPVFMDLVISNIVVITIGMMMYYHGLRAYPFSIEAKDNNQVGSVFKIFFTMFLMLPIGIVQAFLQGIWWGQLVFLMLVIFWFLYYYDSIANQMKDKKIIMSKSL